MRDVSELYPIEYSILFSLFSSICARHESCRGWELAFRELNKEEGGKFITCGLCDYEKKLVSLDPDHGANVDTLLHEIAHIIAGPDAGHGERWIAIADALGADTEVYKLAWRLHKRYVNLDLEEAIDMVLETMSILGRTT